MAASERILERRDKPTEPEGGNHRQAESAGEIEFENVWFAYQDEDWVLKDVSFKIAPGERVAIVGATGSGKTTIISLLNRFYNIQKGIIRLDGHDLKDWDVEDLRRKIGIVQQDVFLFSGDVARNIRLGDTDISQEDLVQAAEDVNASRFIDTLENGYIHEESER